MGILNRGRIIAFIIAIGLILIAIFRWGVYDNSVSKNPNVENSSEVRIVSTNPSGLDGATIFPSQGVEISFNYPIENVGEFKHTLEPKAEYKAELTDDKKTIKITPKEAFELGQGYILTISNDTKFDGGKRLSNPQHFRFQTIKYEGN